MTEDGRKTGMAALSGLAPSLSGVWDHSDAQLDALTNSLWPDGVAGFALCANLAQVSEARPGAPTTPHGRRPVRWNPAQNEHPHRFAIGKIWILEEITHENVSGK
jgi:hypothetical protein